MAKEKGITMADRTGAGITGKPGKNVAKVYGPSNYTPNNVYKKPLTLNEQRKYNKLPKDILFSLPKGIAPKGTEKLSDEEKKQIQARRILDRKRTLARGANIIRNQTLKGN